MKDTAEQYLGETVTDAGVVLAVKAVPLIAPLMNVEPLRVARLNGTLVPLVKEPPVTVSTVPTASCVKEKLLVPVSSRIELLASRSQRTGVSVSPVILPSIWIDMLVLSYGIEAAGTVSVSAARVAVAEPVGM